MNKQKRIFMSALLGVVLLGAAFYALDNADAKAGDPLPVALVSELSLATAPAHEITATRANLYSVIDAKGLKTNYWFEYSIDPSVATSSSATLLSEKSAAGKGEKAMEFASTVFELEPDTVYYYRVAVVNENGVARGEVLSFKTKK